MKTELELNSRINAVPRWFCVMCKARQENKAEDNLKRQGFSVYFPNVPSKIRKQGRVKTIISAMFPGYVFIEADPASQDLSVVRSTLGCIALLRHGVLPAVVAPQIIESIKQAEAFLNGKFETSEDLAAGRKYELLEQGFHGHTATFLTLDGKGRAKVLITLMNSEREVTIAASSLGRQLP